MENRRIRGVGCNNPHGRRCRAQGSEQGRHDNEHRKRSHPPDMASRFHRNRLFNIQK